MYQAFSLLVVLIACVSIVVGNGTQIIDWHALNDAEPNQDDSHIQFILYSRKLREGTTDLSLLKKKLHTYVLIHGFNDNLKDSIMLPLLTKNYLTRERCNVVVVDWAEFAKGPWFINAAKNTLTVGKELAAWLDTSGLDMKRVTLVGFSMGAHVAGDAGHFAQNRVSRIVALDPAHFLFQNSPPEFRLDSTDADIVEVVHTSGGYVGEKEALGTRDFYPNGGTYPQPGCSPDPTGTCSHRRAYYYYSEAILKPDDNFKGRKCNSYEHFVKHKCREKGVPVILHLVNTNSDKHLMGNFYFMTNSKEPFIRRNVSRNGTSTTERHPLSTEKPRSTYEDRRLTDKEVATDKYRPGKDKHVTTDRRSTAKDHTTEKRWLDKQVTTEFHRSSAKEHLRHNPFTTTERRHSKDKNRPEKDQEMAMEDRRSTAGKYHTDKDHNQLKIPERRTEKYRPTKDKQVDDNDQTAEERWMTDKYRPGKDQHSTTVRRSTVREHSENFRTMKENQLDYNDNHRATPIDLTTDKFRPGKGHHSTTVRRSTVREHLTPSKYQKAKDYEDNDQSATMEQPTTHHSSKNQHQFLQNLRATFKEYWMRQQDQTADDEVTTVKRRSTLSKLSSSTATERYRFTVPDDKSSSKLRSTKKRWTTSTKRSVVVNKVRAKFTKKTATSSKPRQNLHLTNDYL